MNGYSALRGRTQIDRRAGAIAQLEVAGDEVGMKVREEDVLDSQAVLGGEREVLIDVALRIDDGGRVRLLVADRDTRRARGNSDRTASGSSFRPFVDVRRSPRSGVIRVRIGHRPPSASSFRRRLRVRDPGVRRTEPLQDRRRRIPVRAPFRPTPYCAACRNPDRSQFPAAAS